MKRGRARSPAQSAPKSIVLQCNGTAAIPCRKRKLPIRGFRVVIPITASFSAKASSLRYELRKIKPPLKAVPEFVTGKPARSGAGPISRRRKTAACAKPHSQDGSQLDRRHLGLGAGRRRFCGAVVGLSAWLRCWRWLPPGSTRKLIASPATVTHPCRTPAGTASP